MRDPNLIREKCESAGRGDGRTQEVRNFGRRLRHFMYAWMTADYIAATLGRCGIDPKTLSPGFEAPKRQSRTIVLGGRAPTRKFSPPTPRIAGWWGVRDGELVFFDADSIR